jgi:CxxC motif-containing protein (DUF1111 family)
MTNKQAVAALALLLLAACGGGTPQSTPAGTTANGVAQSPPPLPALPAPPAPPRQPALGDPVDGLTASELARFQSGQTQFQKVETVADGLGPVFNEASCVACHQGPASAVGGSNGRLVTRFGRVENGVFDPLASLGGMLVQDHAIGAVPGFTYVPEVVPAAANVVAHRRTPPLFGLGLVDAIPDDALRALAAQQARATPDTAGTLSVVSDKRTGAPAVGRFGWKAQVVSLFEFSGDAYLNEMGITNPMFPDENCPQGDCAALAFNPAPDLNDDGGDVLRFTDFMRMLAPPPRGPLTPDVHAGESVARATGCFDCHVPALRSGPADIGALAHRQLWAYSDFLLHDMGALGDGLVQGIATGRQIRTAPLWGLRGQAALLHDGRAQTIAEAVQAHDGQGRGSRDRFARLGQRDRDALLAFLRSL